MKAPLLASHAYEDFTGSKIVEMLQIDLSPSELWNFAFCDIESHNFNVYYILPPLQSTLSLHRLTCFDSDFHRVT